MSDFPDLVPPWSRVPLVHDATDLFPQPTMDALSDTYAGQVPLGVVIPAAVTYADIQAACDTAASTGRRIWAAGTITTSSTLTVASDADFSGLTINHTGASSRAINVTASNVTIEGPRIVGPGNTALNGGSRGIAVVGALGAPLSNVTIRNARISGFREVGVWLEFVDDFTVENCAISDIRYAGILGYSVTRGIIRANRISSITSSPLAYGIAISKASASSSTNPRSADVLIADNIVTAVPNWEGIDTHGGVRIKIRGNTVTACKVGIAVVPASNGTKDTYAPLLCDVEGNTIDSLVTDGSFDNGISFTGAEGAAVGTVTEYATGSVRGNVIRGHGPTSNNIKGSLYIHSTRAVVISGNTIDIGSPFGVSMYHDNVGFLLTGNTFVEPWSSTGTISGCIVIRDQYNYGTVEGNRHAVSGEKTAALLVNACGLRFSTATNVEVIASGNVFSATVAPFAGSSSAVTKVQALVAAPTARAAALTAVNNSTVDGTYGAEEQAVITNTRTRVNELYAALQTLGYVQ